MADRDRVTAPGAGFRRRVAWLGCQAVGVGGESIEARLKRRRQRALFDGVAELYDTSRRGYPDGLVEFMVATAGLGEGGRALEVGCGTGQLTGQLARRGCDVTAIDIGPSMVAGARRRLGRASVRFAVVSFEDFEGDDGSFDLVVSATAFHWVDPEVKFDKTARLLRPGGWLALLATGERYDDPFGTALLEMWVARSDDGGAWVKQKKLADTRIITSTGLFGQPLEKTHAERITLPAEVVIGVESTRATFLSWDPDTRRSFTEQMRRHLDGLPSVNLTQQTTLTIAPVPTTP
jgi:ubiquinone/menaquinone biosynthesis C-methylase UbiE